MPNVRFEIQREDIENDPREFVFSPYEQYGTKEFVDNISHFNGPVSSYEILSGHSEIPVEYHKEWKKSVIDYLNNSNNSKRSGFNKNVKFKILSMDSRYAFEYEEYIGGSLTKKGKGWKKDIISETEKDAWDTAVIQYKKNNGIKCPTSTIDELINDIDEAVNSFDDALPNEIEKKPPLVEFALPELSTDPCKFVNDLMHAGKTSITRICGVPSPIELFNYYIKITKENIKLRLNNLAHSYSNIVKGALTLIKEKINSAKEYFKQLDVEYEEWKKRMSNMKSKLKDREAIKAELSKLNDEGKCMLMKIIHFELLEEILLAMKNLSKTSKEVWKDLIERMNTIKGIKTPDKSGVDFDEILTQLIPLIGAFAGILLATRECDKADIECDKPDYNEIEDNEYIRRKTQNHINESIILKMCADKTDGFSL